MKQEEMHKLIDKKPWIRYDSGDGSVPPRCSYIPGGAAECVSINGKWRFIYSDDVRALDVNKKPEIVNIPSTWQYDGYDTHQYLNTRYPTPFRPPYVPKRTRARYTVKQWS